MSSSPGRRPGVPPEKRGTVTNSEPLEPRKRPRIESTRQESSRKYYLEGKYCDDYRLLFNQVVQQAATRFVPDVASHQHHAWQVGASLWSPDEQATLYVALERLGKDNVPGIANAIGTKSIPETRALLLLLEDAAAKQGDAKVTLRDIPAALDVSSKCNEKLDLAAEALAWNQERWEACQEQKQFGDYWLITPAVAQEIEVAINSDQLPGSTKPIESEVESQNRGGRGITGACLSCKKLKEKCDRKIPCGNCQKRKRSKCEYPELSRTAQTEISSILEALPEATLLRPKVMLELSKKVFMNRSPAISSPWPHWSEYTSEIAQEPSIYRTALVDFHNLVVILTRRLVQTAIIQATMRLRSHPRNTAHSVGPLVKKRDVRAAIDILGMQRNGKQRWINVARRCALRVHDYETSSDGKKRSEKEMSWDEVERTLNLASPTAGTPIMDAETPGDYSKPRSEASCSETPLPLEDLALYNSDDSTLDEVAPISQPLQQLRDATGDHVRQSLAEDDELLAPELVSLEQFDREASRQEEEKLWAMLGLEPPEDDGDKDDDSEEDLSQDEKIITLPNGWRSCTDYHAEWEEFYTLPHPAPEPVDSRADDSESTQSTRQFQREPVVSELQTSSSLAYVDQQLRAFERESSSASDGEDKDVSDGESEEEGMNRPMPSVDTDARSSLLRVSEDGGINMASQPTVPINSRRKTRLPARSDDELNSAPPSPHRHPSSQPYTTETHTIHSAALSTLLNKLHFTTPFYQPTQDRKMKSTPFFVLMVTIIALMVALMPGTAMANRDPPKNPNCGAPFCARARVRALAAASVGSGGQEVGTVKAATGSNSKVDKETSVMGTIKRWLM
ncbi:dna-binding protein [Curvularia clavata]|uniref:Dna-binding protein n=1 Tax=Curvularia clavata TaxID=95742 RepID=A0A9Q8Z478_CURCL|nr:dna-binding protein [Curvularia clavata]